MVANRPPFPIIDRNAFLPYSCTVMKNSIVISFLSVFVLSVFVMSGCDSAKPKNQNQRRQPVGMEGIGIADIPQDPPVQKEPEQTEDNTVVVKAEPGLTGRGNYGTTTGNNPMEIITVPISTYFRVQDRIVLQRIEAAMKLYKGQHEKGPATHAEYMEKIIRENNIPLPRLPDGHEYLYDPKDEELKVRKPRD